ncbi:hypothetical protein Tco_0311533 [Tanacetum coccineum]
MEEINHFSHEKHPLQLINGETIVSVGFKDGDNEQKPEAVGCFACVKPISPSQHPLKLINMRTTGFKAFACDACRLDCLSHGLCYSPNDVCDIFTACINCCVVEISHNVEADVGLWSLRAFLEKQKLIGPNFIDWYRNLWIVLSVEDKLTYLEHPIPVVPVLAPGQAVDPDVLAAHTTWVKASKEIVGLMLMTMDLEIQKNLEHLGAYYMLTELKTLFSQQQNMNFFKTVEENFTRAPPEKANL